MTESIKYQGVLLGEWWMQGAKSIEAEKKFDKTSETERLSPIGSARSFSTTGSGSTSSTYNAAGSEDRDSASDREQTPIDV